MKFTEVSAIGVQLPGVVATRRYDGSPVLKLDGCFLAGMATHRTAEPHTLVVRSDFEARALLLEDAPETYYVTDFYERYPLVLVRLQTIHRDAVRDLLTESWKLTREKTRSGGRFKLKLET